VGQVMKISQGKANPGKVNELLREKIKWLLFRKANPTC
jgi:Asp-tRNA(Asn)/Glu-tRNA(Gln) amidotransferase B subunit